MLLLSADCNRSITALSLFRTFSNYTLFCYSIVIYNNRVIFVRIKVEKMEVSINIDKGMFTKVRKVTITLGEIEYRITESEQGGIVINKMSYGTQDCAISINPKTSNEIRVK